LRHVIAPIAIIAMALPGTPAIAKKPPPGRTIVLTVKGVPKASKATILLKGPKRESRKVKTRGHRTVRHLKPGVYRIQPKRLTTGKGIWIGKPKPKKVSVSRRKGARVRVVYSAPTVPTPPPDEDRPDTPFPGALAPSAVALISKSAGGSPGNKASVGPAWSPDGQHVAFSSCASNLGGAPDTLCHLYQHQPADGTVARIANTDMTDIHDWGGEVAWSPDGTRMAFTTMRPLVGNDTDANKDVYLVSAAGTGPQRVSQTQAGAGMQGDPAAAHDPQWSPDSARIMFASSASNLGAGSGDLFIKNLTSGVVTRTGAGELSEGARWASDGRIAFTAGSYVWDPDWAGWWPNLDVYTADTSGTSVTAATSDHGVLGPPSWAPSGSAIAFSTSMALVASDTNEVRDVYTTGNPAARISTTPDGLQSLWESMDPVWSPDGQKVAFIAQDDGPTTVIVKNLATGTVTQLVDPRKGSVCEEYQDDEETGERYCAQYTYYEASDPAWSPDSTRVAFTSDYPDLVPGDTNGTEDVFIATL